MSKSVGGQRYECGVSGGKKSASVITLKGDSHEVLLPQVVDVEEQPKLQMRSQSSQAMSRSCSSWQEIIRQKQKARNSTVAPLCQNIALLLTLLSS